MASLSSSTLASRIHLRPKLSRITTRSSPATRSASSTPSHQPPIRKRQSTHPPSRVPWRTQRLLFSSSSSSPLLLLPPNANHLVHYHHHHPSRRSLHHSSGFPQPMADLNRKLGETQPCFPVRGDEIQVLSEPQEFFQALLDLIKRARKRLVISSLYIGVEQDQLLAALRSALAAQPSLRITFLLDYHRCTREPYPKPSTASVLSSLVRDHPGRVEAWFFRCPTLKGIMEMVVPRRFDEGFGTWHSKVYAGDEEVIISGANLSKDYFTTRQDRYFYFRNSLHFTTYLANLLRLYTQYSYQLVPLPLPSSLPSSSPSNTSSSDPTTSALTWTTSFLAPLLDVFRPSPPTQPYQLVWQNLNVESRDFEAHATATISTFQRSWQTRTQTFAGRRVDADTTIFPALQVGPLGLNEEVNAMGLVWDAVETLVKEEEKAEEARNGRERKGVRRPRVDLTTGYFGLFGGYKKRVLEGNAEVRIVAASPEANGFFRSKGVSGLIPEGYTLLEREFEREVRRRGKEWKETNPIPIGAAVSPPLPPPASAISGATAVVGSGEGSGESKVVGTGLSTMATTLMTPAPMVGKEGSGVEVTEWEREGWTYHAKGIWLSPTTSHAPLLTLLGSSNLSTRSVKLDVETSFFITTTSPELQDALKREVAGLRAWSEGRRVGEETWRREERKVGWKTWWIMRVLRVENLL